MHAWAHNLTHLVSMAIILLSFDGKAARPEPTDFEKKQFWLDGLQHNIKKNLHIIKTEDVNRFGDCKDYGQRRAHRFRPYKYLHFFTSIGQNNTRNGLMSLDGWPILVHLYNYRSYSQRQGRVVMAFRGDTWGIQKSYLTPQIYRFIKNNPKDMLFVYDDYLYTDKKHNIKKSNVMVLCHKRSYPGYGYVGKSSPALSENRSWKLVNSYLPEEQRLLLISYSIGSVPRNEFLNTRVVGDFKPDYKNIKNPSVFLKEYKQNTNYTSAEIDRIEGLVDFEGNFSRNHNLWNLIRFLDDYVINDASRSYYAACSTSVSALLNHVVIIKALHLKGKQFSNNVIRYKNKEGNIVIDILVTSRRFAYKLKETEYEKYASRLRLMPVGHFSILPWAMGKYIEFSKLRDQQ